MERTRWEIESARCMEIGKPGKHDPSHCSHHAKPKELRNLFDREDATIEHQHDQRTGSDSNEGPRAKDDTHLQWPEMQRVGEPGQFQRWNQVAGILRESEAPGSDR